ncbi:unnamed protein product [Caretta caretta]
MQGLMPTHHSSASRGGPSHSPTNPLLVEAGLQGDSGRCRERLWERLDAVPPIRRARSGRFPGQWDRGTPANGRAGWGGSRRAGGVATFSAAGSRQDSAAGAAAILRVGGARAREECPARPAACRGPGLVDTAGGSAVC